MFYFSYKKNVAVMAFVYSIDRLMKTLSLCITTFLVKVLKIF